tara:strand:- start:11040 stop:11474 length:435 start_codon:yes stop_codon:yes gene_type:complete
MPQGVVGLIPTDPYLAGLVDGEGSIGLYRTGGKYFRPSLAIGMVGSKEQAVLQQLARLHGGQFRTEYRQDGQIVHRWTLTTVKTIEPVLRRLIPHLLLKQDQAKLLLHWCHLPSSMKHGEYATKISEELKHIKASTKGRKEKAK